MVKKKKKKKKKKNTKKIFFPRTKTALRLNLGIYHLGLEVYQICSNDDPRMTFLRHGQICVLVVVAILEECCIAYVENFQRIS